MKSLDKLKEQVKGLIDKAQDKELVTSLAELDGTIKEVESDTAQLETSHTELLNDYKDMVKSCGFKRDNNDNVIEPTPAPTLDDVIAKVISERK